MSQRQDCKLAWVIEEGYIAQAADGWHAWLTDQGFIGQVNDQEYAWLGSLGYTGQLMDRWFNYLRDLGATGALPDMMRQFWCGDAGAGIGPGPVQTLLDARFDSYPGIADQALSDAQVLGRQQGVEVGGLTLLNTGGLTNPKIGGDQFIAGLGTGGDGSTGNLHYPSDLGDVEGQYVKWKGPVYINPSVRNPFVGLYKSLPTAQGVRSVDCRINGTDFEVFNQAGAAEIIDADVQDGEIYEILIIQNGGGGVRVYRKRGSVGIWEDVGPQNANPVGVNYFAKMNRDTGNEWETDQIDIGTGAEAILNWGGGVGPVDSGTAALIDALTGDIVSASFGPAETASNVLTLTNADELHDDYPANGVGKIRKDVLVFQSPDVTGLLSGGVGLFDSAGAAQGRVWHGDELIPVEPGLGVMAKWDIKDWSAVADAVSWAGEIIWTSNLQRRYRYRVSTGGALVASTSTGAAFADTTVLPDGSVSIGSHDFDLWLGGYDSAGQPDPEGLYGCIYHFDGVPVFSSELYNNASLCPQANDEGNRNLLDLIQVKADKSKIRTPQRALFADTFLEGENRMVPNGEGWTQGVLDEADRVNSRIIGDTLISDAANNNLAVQWGKPPALPSTATRTYRVTYTITSRVAGQVRIEYGGGLGTWRSSAGTYVEDITAIGVGGTNFNIASGSGTFEGEIDLSSIKASEIDRAIDNYIPEDGVPFSTVIGEAMVVQSGHLITLASGGSTRRAALINNLGGGYWEMEVELGASFSEAGFWLRYQDVNNCHRVYATNNSLGFYRIVCAETIGGSAVGIFDVTTTLAVGVGISERFIFRDTGSRISMICPSSGEVAGADTVAGAGNTGAGILTRHFGADGDLKINHVAARTGSVLPY